MFSTCKYRRGRHEFEIVPTGWVDGVLAWGVKEGGIETMCELTEESPSCLLRVWGLGTKEVVEVEVGAVSLYYKYSLF